MLEFAVSLVIWMLGLFAFAKFGAKLSGENHVGFYAGLYWVLTVFYFLFIVGVEFW